MISNGRILCVLKLVKGISSKVNEIIWIVVSIDACLWRLKQFSDAIVISRVNPKIIAGNVNKYSNMVNPCMYNMLAENKDRRKKIGMQDLLDAKHFFSIAICIYPFVTGLANIILHVTEDATTTIKSANISVCMAPDKYKTLAAESALFMRFRPNILEMFIIEFE